MPETQGEWLRLAAETVLDLIPGGKAMKALKGVSYKLGIKKLEKQLLREGGKMAKLSKNASKSFKKISGKLLEGKRIDAHQLKRDWLGKKSDIAKYDLYRDTKTGEILILQKGGIGVPIQTGEFIN